MMTTQTGDEATICPDGYITITGRVKDLIIRGGENIHPLEVENCLLAYPGVLNVSVVGVPDERYGEAVAAFIIHRDPDGEDAREEKVKRYVNETLSNHLGAYSPRGFQIRELLTAEIVPKYVFFLPSSESFPKTASGKVQKVMLREIAVKSLKERESRSV